MSCTGKGHGLGKLVRLCNLHAYTASTCHPSSDCLGADTHHPPQTRPTHAPRGFRCPGAAAQPCTPGWLPPRRGRSQSSAASRSSPWSSPPRSRRRRRSRHPRRGSAVGRGEERPVGGDKSGSGGRARSATTGSAARAAVMHVTCHWLLKHKFCTWQGCQRSLERGAGAAGDQCCRIAPHNSRNVVSQPPEPYSPA